MPLVVPAAFEACLLALDVCCDAALITLILVRSQRLGYSKSGEDVVSSMVIAVAASRSGEPTFSRERFEERARRPREAQASMSWRLPIPLTRRHSRR